MNRLYEYGITRFKRVLRTRGDEPFVYVPHHFNPFVFSAHAEMNRQNSKQIWVMQCVLRTRGDEPGSSIILRGF